MSDLLQLLTTIATVLLGPAKQQLRYSKTNSSNTGLTLHVAEEILPGKRGVIGAPLGMRRELFDLLTSIADEQPVITGRTGGQFDRDRNLHVILANFLGGPKSGINRQRYEMENIAWPNVYNLIKTFWCEMWARRISDPFTFSVNRILTKYGVAWELREIGVFRRILPDGSRPDTTNNYVPERFWGERGYPAYVLGAAYDAFDSCPRRDRDACGYAYEVMEDVAKAQFHMPEDSFGEILPRLDQIGAISHEMFTALDRVVALRNENFVRRDSPFSLTTPEVDFVYSTCMSAISLLGRRVTDEPKRFE